MFYYWLISIQDLCFETIPATRFNSRYFKKTKKKHKALPPGISEHNRKVLTKIKRKAYRLDMSFFNYYRIRFGWSNIIRIVLL
jgi:hypothetical protein